MAAEGEMTTGQRRASNDSVMEITHGLRIPTAQAGLGGSCGVSLVSVGLSVPPTASTPM